MDESIHNIRKNVKDVQKLEKDYRGIVYTLGKIAVAIFPKLYYNIVIIKVYIIRLIENDL